MGIYRDMKIIITERQYRLINENQSENEILIRKYYEMYNQLPTYNELTQLKNKKVGDIYPEHSKANSVLSSWIKNYARDFNQIINKIANENDILFKRSKIGGQKVVSFDGKYRFESKYESIFYNIFALEGLQDELIYESQEFKKDCKKVPDFTWKERKMVFEIGGMTRENYWKKMYDAKSCIESKGYQVIIFDITRNQQDFIGFYKKVCDICGFEIRNDVVTDINKILKLKEITKKELQQEIDKLINKFDRTTTETARLINYVKHLGYLGINDYKQKHDLGKFKTSIPGIRKRVVELINQKYKIDDIAKTLSLEFGKKISSGVIDDNIKRAKELGELPNEVLNKDYIYSLRRKENYPSKDELNALIGKVSWEEMGRRYSVSGNAMKKRAKSYGLIKNEKKDRLNENELVSLVKRTIMEGYEEKLKWSSFSKEQLKRIKNLGFKVLVNIKNFTKQTEEGVKDINYWLEQHNLTIRKPSYEYIKQNIEDIEFALKDLPLSNGVKFLLNKNLQILENEKNNFTKDYYIFYEKSGETFKWSLVNLYDNNIKLWIRLLNKRYTFPGKVNIDSLIEKYFGDCSVNTFAAKDILNAMINDREILSKEVFEDTWEGGRDVEESFIKDLLKRGIFDDIKVFSGEGNFVDRAGIDLAIKYDGVWIPVQVKRTGPEAKSSVPEQGISVFPSGSRFYCYDGGETPITFEEFLEKII